MHYLTRCVLAGVLFAVPSVAQPTLNGCPVLPADNIWNTPVDQLPVASQSGTYINTIGPTRTLRADFGSGLWEGGPMGIPFVVVPGTQQKYPATFQYASQSDRGPYAIPLNAPIEGGSESSGDRHAIAVDKDNCILYELYAAYPQVDGWRAGSGAIFNLRSNALRPSGWTSADAAGLPMMPGLVRFDEVAAGEIRHALRFTVPQTRRAFIWPARHYASSLTGTQYPPMGQRFRLKAGFDISGFSPQVQVILRALKKYGMILADNGSAFYLSGLPDERWNNTMLRELLRVAGSNLEAVDVSSLMIDPDSGQARQSVGSTPPPTISLSPSTATVQTGGTVQFTATVTGANGQPVVWSVAGITGGNTSVGTISTTGLYRAPTVAGTFTVRATIGTVSATATATVQAAAPSPLPSAVITSVTPTSFPVGSFTLTISGQNFVSGSRVRFAGGGTATWLLTTFISPTRLTATGSVTVSGARTVRVQNPDGIYSNTINVNVTSPVLVSVSPSSATVMTSATRQFTATVTGTSNTAVTWSVNGITGGNTTVGTISTSGLYTAPRTVPNPAAATIRATSVAAPTATGTATVTIQAPVTVTVSPSSASVILSTTRQFTATVAGTSNTAVTWSVNGMTGGNATVGTISTSGLYTAPGTVPNPATATIRATSVATPTASGTATVTIQAPVTVTVSPSSASVTLSTTRQFTATVAGTSNTAVTWSVNGITGGNTTSGTISTSGLYTAPGAVPNPATATIRATSVATPTASGAASVAIQAPATVTVTVSPSSASIELSTTRQFTATVAGTTNTAVTWSVNDISGGNATVGTISATGLYTAPAAVPSPALVTVRATSVATPSSRGSAALTVLAPGSPGDTSNLSAARFLEQAAYGPTPSELARVKQIGIDAWLADQFNLPESTIPDPGGMNSGTMQTQYLHRLGNAPDQLRQRMADALAAIIVISLNKNIYPDQIVPYRRILSKNAFGNYRTLLGEISTSSQMGHYLDLANSNKPVDGSGANENYARELLQLFTIGLYELNLDGSTKLDSSSKPIPTYNQATVQQVALALTGWTYIGPDTNNWNDFSGPLQPKDVNHDMRQKVFFGCTLPAGQTTVQDMNATLDCLFRHPNVGPFIATRLIRSLVTSNPSRGYIQRVAAVFNDNGAGVRGDLKAVARAILTDSEARNDAATPSSGRLKDPIYHIISFARALNTRINPGEGQGWLFSQMAQEPLTPPSVFNFYSPLFRIPNSSLFGPEFQIYTPTESVMRANFIYAMLTQQSDYSVDMTPFRAVAGNTTQLIDAVDKALLYGRMPSNMRQSLATAIAAQPDNNSKALTAVYLTALSGFFAVQF